MKATRLSATLVFLLIVYVVASNAVRNSTVIRQHVFKTNDIVYQIWKTMEKKMEKTAQVIISNIKTPLLETLRDTNVSQPCISSILSLMSGLTYTKTWAAQMIDASGKIPEGILRGTVSAFGSYDECVSIKTDVEGGPQVYEHFRGQYCTVEIRPHLPPAPHFQSIAKGLDIFRNFTAPNKVFSIISKNAHYFNYISYRVGICLPSTCSKEDVQRFSDRVSSWMYMSSHVKGCEVKEELKLETFQIFIISIFLAVGGLIMFATFLDICQRRTYRKNEHMSMFLKCTSTDYLLTFSLYTNGKKIFSTKSAKDTIGALHGIRLISILWIIWSHTYFFINYQVFTDSFLASDFVSSFMSQPIVNGTVAVDTFFYLSGLLTFYLTLQLLEKNEQRLNIPVYLLHRYWRLAPPLIFTISLTMLIPLLGSGPLWHEGIDHVVEGCRKYWWANMLFINNFLTTKNVCLNYSWYLPNDFQFHILSLLILLPLMRSTVRGLLITATLVLSSMVITGAITEFYDYPATRLYGLPTTDEVWEFCTRIYFQPYTHLGAYCVGAMVGYLLAKKQQIALSPFQQVSGWILSIAGLMLVLYGTYDWNRGQETSRATVVLYAATHRTVWALAIAWLTVACVYGYGGLLNTFLSLKIFVVLDRVTYAAYLIHPLFQQVYHSRLRVHLSGDQYVGIYGYLGNLMVVYPSAFLFTLLFESPFLSLEKLLLTRFTERKGIQRFT